MELLLNAGADPTYITTSGLTAYDIAVERHPDWPPTLLARLQSKDAAAGRPLLVEPHGGETYRRKVTGALLSLLPFFLAWWWNWTQ